MKTALITGITGQDGSYLAELLLSKGYVVYGIDKNSTRLKEYGLENKVKFIQADISDSVELYNTLKSIPKLDEFYNFAAVSNIPESIKRPYYTGKLNALVPQMMMEFLTELHPKVHFFQASSSAMYGDTKALIYNEETPFNPNNPYGVAKLYAHNIAKYYRNNRNLFVSCGILFNHESTRRGMEFVTQKVAYAAACAKLNIGQSNILDEGGSPLINNGKIKLGNINSLRDWGYAPDYVKAMCLMLQQEKAGDFVIATGELHSVEELLQVAFSYVGKKWQNYVVIDKTYIRKGDKSLFKGDNSKAKNLLSWRPIKSFRQLVCLLVDANITNLRK